MFRQSDDPKTEMEKFGKARMPCGGAVSLFGQLSETGRS
jgi:hypothetical protein